MEINIEEYDKSSLTKIGEGSFSEIFKIKEKSSEKTFAAKVLNKDVYDEDDELRIRREIEIISSCIHPTIVKFYGISNKDFFGKNNIVIIMEYAENKSLSEAIKNAKRGMADYDNTKIQIILIGIARAMMILHQKHIIHRDLKPDNILLNEKFQPLISDFNLSKKCKMGESYNQSHYFGTPAYMAPEVFFQTDKYNFKADVFSFGAIMYEILTNEQLIPVDKIKSPEDMVKFRQNFEIKFNVPIKNGFKKLIEQCLSIDPNERPNFSEIYNKLKNISDDDFALDGICAADVEDYIEIISKNCEESELGLSMLATVDYLEKQNEELEADVSYLKKCCEEFKRLKSETDQLLKDNEFFKKEIEQSKSDRDQLLKDNEFFKKEIEQSKSDRDQLLKDNEFFKKEIEQSKSDRDQLLKDNEFFKKEIEQSKSDRDKLLKDNEFFKKECEKMKSDRDKLLKDNEFFKKECDQAKIERGQLDERVTKLEKLLEGLLLKVENCGSDEKITLILGRIDLIEKEIQNWKLTYKPEVIGLNDDIWKKINEMLNDIEQFKIQIREQIKAANTISINELEKKVNDMIFENDKLKKLINDFNERIKNIDVINHDFVIKIINENKKNNDNSDLHTKLEELRLKIDKLSQVNYRDEHYRDFIIKIINENKTINSTTDINIILERLQNQINKLTHENDELIKKVNGYDERIQKINVINHDYVIKIINENKTLNSSSDINKKFEELQNQINKLTRENDELLHKINGYDAKIQRSNELNEQIIIKKIKEIHLHSNDDSKTNIKYYENKINDLSRQIEEKNQQILDQQMKFNQRIQTIETKNMEIIRIYEKQSPNKSLNHGKYEISDLVNLINQMEGKLNSVIQDNERLKEKVKIQEQQLHSRNNSNYNDNNNQLMAMILELKNQVESNARDNELLKKQLIEQEAKFSLQLKQSKLNQNQIIQQNEANLKNNIYIKRDPVVKPGTGYKRPKPSPNIGIYLANRDNITHNKSLDQPVLNSLLPIENPTKIVSIDYFKDIPLSNPEAANLKNLLQYILQYGDEAEAEKYIDIHQDMKEIYINSPATELLYENHQLGQDKFNQIINSFELFTIEFKYPSKLFNDIYQCISQKIFERYRSKASISLKIENLEDIQSKINDKNYISKIILDSCIDSILASSFSGCNKLKNIIVPDSVLSIDKFSFDNCSSLMNFKIPNKLSLIGNCAFRNCLKLTEINLPGSVETIGNCAFNNCSALIKVIFPPSSITKSIGDFAFCDCIELKEINLPSSIIEIGEGSFKNCRKMVQITIPRSVKKIGNSLFEGCIFLNQIALPKTLKIDKKNGINDNIKIIRL